jgi:nicotinate phosphoribosyltransferase
MIINSLLDLDYYKLLVHQAVVTGVPKIGLPVRFKLFCRGARNLRDAGFDEKLLALLGRNINHLGDLRFTSRELDYLASIHLQEEGFIAPVFNAEYLNYLHNFRLNPSQVHCDAEGIEVTGPWAEVTLFETLILSILSELVSLHKSFDLADHMERLRIYVNGGLWDYNLTEFGTRRRVSRAFQEGSLRFLRDSGCPRFLGTSNVDLAYQLGLEPMGTMPHEYMQAFQVLHPDIKRFQADALHYWWQVYHNRIPLVALTDTISTPAFWKDIRKPYQGVDLFEVYSGFRQDSGDPLQWANQFLSECADRGVSPASKRLVFSDGLNLHSARDIYIATHPWTNPSIAIGTALTRPWDTREDAQFVIKMVEFNGQPVVKISDSPGKGTHRGHPRETELMKIFEVA